MRPAGFQGGRLRRVEDQRPSGSASNRRASRDQVVHIFVRVPDPDGSRDLLVELRFAQRNSAAL
jgi:hypothetical protein